MKSKSAILTLAMLGAFATLGFARGQSTPPPPPPPNAPAGPSKPTRIRIGGNVQGAKLITKVQPVYPPPAAAKGVQGNVVLHAVIGRDGSVKALQVISGDPLLTQAALDAVRKWMYAPTLLNGDPVEVDTTITVVFKLDAKPPQQQAAPAAQAASPAQAPAATQGHTMPGQTPPAAAPAIDPQLKADILHLFQVIKLRENTADSMHATIDKLRPQLIASLPATPNRDKIVETYLSRLLALVQSDDFVNGTVAVYAKYLSDADVKALIAFYQTPAGEHYNAASTNIFAATSQVGQENVARNLPGILKDLCSEYPELQGQARFCPKIELAPANPAAPPTPAAPGATAAPSAPGAPTPPATPPMHPPDDRR
ncbi:MAG: TonB family protein [Candidatus Acidiferrales bacterium]